MDKAKLTPFNGELDKPAAPSQTLKPFDGTLDGEEAGIGARIKQGVGRAIDSARTALTDDPNKIAQIASEQAASALPQSPVQERMAREFAPYVERANKAEGVVDNVTAWGSAALKRGGQLLSNPGESVKMIAEQVPNSAPALAGGYVGMKAGAAIGTAVAPGPGTIIGGLLGSVAGGFAGSYGLEKGASMQEQVQKEAQTRNIDIQNQAEVAKMVAQKQSEFDAAAQRKAVGTAGTDAVLNTLTMGVAGVGGRALAKEALSLNAAVKAGTISAADATATLARLQAANAARNTIGAKAARGAGVVGAEMGGESLSEAAGQMYAHGRVDAGEVIDEGLLGLGTGGAMALGSKAFNKAAGIVDQDGITRDIEAAQSGLASLGPAFTTSPGAADPAQPGPTSPAAPVAPDWATSPGAATPNPYGGIDFTREVDTSGLSLADPADTIASRLKPSEVMGLNPSAGALSREVAAFVDAQPFTEVTPIETRTGIGAQRRLGEQTIIDVDAREVIDPQQTIAARLAGPSQSAPLQQAIAQLPYNPATQGDSLADQAPQAIQAATQRTQAGAAQAEPTLTDGYGQAWDSLDTETRTSVARSAGARGVLARNVASKGWGDLSPNLRSSISTAIESARSVGAPAIQLGNQPQGASNVGNAIAPQAGAVPAAAGSPNALAQGERGVGLSGNGDGVGGRLDGAGQRVAGAGFGEAGIAPVAGRSGVAPTLTQGAAPILQNRNRSNPSSIAQMQGIAADPDYGRLGFSRDFANGAPVVAGGQVAPEQMGRQDVAVASDGRRIPVQYAVVEASDVLASNQVDGTPNADYGNQSVTRIRAIAGNGRIAGLQRAYGMGTSDGYAGELLGDALHGVNPDVIRSMRQPVLVRVMPVDQVTQDIGDVSNTTGNLSLSPVEQANNDAQRVSLDALQFSEDGAITSDTVRQFVRAMPQAEQGGLIDTNGQPTKQAVDRINAAVFARAYGNDQLIRLFAQAQDPEARNVLSALAQVAPKMARLEGAGSLDIRDVVTQAAEIAVNARREGRPLANAASQIDMTADPMVGEVLKLFARNARTVRPVVDALGAAADFAYTEANKPAEDMFGAVPKATRGDVLGSLSPQNEQASQANLEQPAGGKPVQVDAVQPAADAGAATDAAATQAGRPAEADQVDDWRDRAGARARTAFDDEVERSIANSTPSVTNDLPRESAAGWRAAVERRVGKWGVVDNEMDNVDRITLIKGNDLAHFYYRKGDDADRQRATSAAEAWAKSSERKPDREALTLEAQTEEDLRAKAEREDAATSEAAAEKAAEQERLRREAEARDNKARADATVDDFQLGQTADQQMSGMDDMFGGAQDAAPAAEPAGPAAPAQQEAQQASDDQDWMTALFGGEQEQTANQTTAFTPRRDPVALRAVLADAKREAEAARDDWASRTYKQNRTQVELRGDGPSRQDSKSVSAINESRRQKNIEALNQEIAAIERVQRMLASEQSASRLLDILNNTMEQAEQAVQNRTAVVGKTPAEAFEYQILQRLDIKPERGAFTSNRVSKALLAYLQGEQQETAQQDAAPDPLLTPQISGNPENFIKVAADSVRELRSVDVDRVLTETPVRFRAEVASYIRDQRKDLADEVDDVMADLIRGVEQASVAQKAAAPQADTPKLSAEDLANHDKALLAGSISVQDYMDATGLTDEDVGSVLGDGLRQQADREAMAADPYHQGIQKMQEALADQMRAARATQTSTPQQRKSKDERIGRIGSDSATLDMIARGFEHPFDNRYVTKLSPMLKARFNKQWESIKTGEFAKRDFQEASYKLWAQKVIDKAHEKLGAPEPAQQASAAAQPDTPAAKPTKPTATIEDSGQVLEGARKMYAANYAAKLDEGMGMDVAAVPLSKSWPEPDYQRLLDEGADPWAVAFMHAVRDEIPTKPSKGWKLKGWVQKVELLRDLASRATDGRSTTGFIQQTLAKHTGLAGWHGRVELYEAVGHGISLKGVTLEAGEYGIYGGEKFNPPKTIWAVNFPKAGSSWGNDVATGDTKAEAIEKFKAWHAKQGDTPAKEAKLTSFDIYTYRSKPGVIVGKRLSATKSIDLKTFATVKEAREYKAANQDELERLLAQAKDEPSERRETNAPRVGDDHRNGADVTTEQFRETFGFRGEQFGASMPQGERQANLNMAYDALMDLAGTVGIPPRALSLNGELGLAFGARGHGGKRAFAAHYEADTTGSVTPSRVVINLTRKNGAGSLAHEWFHAVDNYFGRMRGMKAGFLTESYADRGDGVRPEMVSAFRDLMGVINRTGMKERSSKLDATRVKDYWSTGLEMAARSFESYVIAKLQDQNKSNDYLANVVNETLYAMQGAYPYPSMGEMTAIRAAFDNFFQTIQTRETEGGNVAMFSRMGAITTRDSDAQLTAAQQITDAIAARWQNAPADIIVARNMQDASIPEAVRKHDAELKSQGATGEPRGFIYKGKVYLLSDQLKTTSDVIEVLFHESLGHYGLRGVFGDSLKSILQQVGNMRRADVVAKAREYGLFDAEKVGDNASDRDVWASMTDKQRLDAAEEVLAEMAQTRPDLGFVRRAISAIRNWLRTNVPGFQNLRMKDADIVQAYLLPARGWVERGGVSSSVNRQVANEPGARYSAREQDLLFSGDEAPTSGRPGYETDLFGDPLPISAGRLAPARSAQSGVRGDTQPATGLSDTAAPEGSYRVRTIIGQEVSRKLGADTILTPEQAAQATAYLYRSAVERFDAIVTDKNGKPLAVVGSFKGALTQTSVYPGTVIAEAVRVPGAARIWFSHNHPSGKSTLSDADKMLNSTLSSVFDGTSIEPMGTLAVTGKSFEHVSPDGLLTYGATPAPSASINVPVIERELDPGNKDADIILDSPAKAREHGSALYRDAGEPGLMILDAQHRVAAWVPVRGAMKGKLMGTGGLDAVYRAVSESNAGSVIIIHGGELDAGRGDGNVWSIAQNLGAALRGTDVRVLDIIDVNKPRSAAETGADLVARSVFSRNQDQTQAEFDRGAASAFSDIAEHFERYPSRPPAGMTNEEAKAYLRDRRASMEALVDAYVPRAEGLLMPVRGSGGFWGVTREARPDGDEWRVTRFDRNMEPQGHEAQRSARDAVADVLSWVDPARLSQASMFSRTQDQTQAPEFKRWFAGSRVVDADGKPLVVYHGTAADFDAFDKKKSGAVWSSDKEGFFFSSESATASEYADFASSQTGGAANVMPVYVSLKNPLTLEKFAEITNGIRLRQRHGDGADALTRFFDEERDLLVRYAKQEKNDGILLEKDGKKLVVAFRPEQIKSAIGNNGNFDPADPRINFSRTSTATGTQSAWDAPTPTGFDDVIYKLQDKNIDAKRVIEAITKSVGKVADAVNVYLQEELFHGRAASRVAEFGARELKPMLNQMKLAGLTMDEVEEFLHARHAKEANAVIAQRNPGDPGMQDGGSGMTNADADAYFAKLPASQRSKLEAIAKRVDAMIADTRKLYVQYGLEDQAVVDGWTGMFKSYIPLMRENKDGGMGIGQGFSVKGKEVKGRTGSKRKVVDILANIAAQREKVIVRGEKNRVSQALVGLAWANPNNGFWEVRSQAPTERVYDEKLKKVVDRPDPMFKSRDNVVGAKVKDSKGNVTEQFVVFNEDDPRAMRMAAAMKNLDAGNLEGLLGVSAKITRYFSAINTQYNPVFGVVNLVRDVQAAMVNLAATPLAGQQANIAKDTVSALLGIHGDIRKTREGGMATSKWAQLWEQMQEDGGTTGYRELFKTSADRGESLKAIINPNAWMDSKWGKVFTADGKLKVPMSVAKEKAGDLFNWLSDYNEAMENGVRLAAYKAALDKGMSRQQAASLSKNLTVNFNRKGQVGMQAGAVYAFFNAAMQGTARIGQTLFDMDGGDIKTLRLSGVGKKVVYGGVLLGVMQALALSAAGFDDEDPPEFLRERSLIIPTGGKTYISIPMPLGLHVIPGLGRHATEFALSGFSKPAERAVSVVGMFADAFNPIGNAGLSMQTIAPTALDPFVALSENRDWTGKPIARTSFNKAEPGHNQWKDTATGFSKTTAEAINWLSGGNEYVAGAFSPTPDQIDYLIAQVGGGVAREVSKIMQTSSAITSGEELPTYKMPLFGRFLGSANGQASQGSAFYANLNKLNALETEIKGLRKDGKYDEAAALVRERPESSLIAFANKAERDVQKLRRDKRELIASDADRDAVRAKEDQITAVMTRLNELTKKRVESAQ